MKTIALNHAESRRRLDDRRAGTTATENLDLIGIDLRDIFAASATAIPDELLALARQLDKRQAAA